MHKIALGVTLQDGNHIVSFAKSMLGQLQGCLSLFILEGNGWGMGSVQQLHKVQSLTEPAITNDISVQELLIVQDSNKHFLLQRQFSDQNSGGQWQGQVAAKRSRESTCLRKQGGCFSRIWFFSMSLDSIHSFVLHIVQANSGNPARSTRLYR